MVLKLGLSLFLFSFGLSVIGKCDETPSDVVNARKELLSVRDPFRMPTLVSEEVKNTSPLQLFSSQQFKFLGVVTGANRLRAMLQAPSGETFFVGLQDRIGTRGGAIAKITADKVIVREKVVNVLGEEEMVSTEIKMAKESLIT